VWAGDLNYQQKNDIELELEHELDPMV